MIDFFNDAADPGLPLIERVFPKYLAMAVDGDLKATDNAAGRLKKVGATRCAWPPTPRPARPSPAASPASARSPRADRRHALAGAAGRRDRPHGTQLKTAIEVDCVSKSRLRSALEEITPALQAAHGPIHYFPSYEIVRWLGPMLKLPTFGQDDGAARHVSGAILDAVCARFLGEFVQWTDGAGGGRRT